MSRYRKWWVAVAGVLAQLLVAVEAALDVGAIPEAWRPWVFVVIALATAVGVRRTPNAPDPAPRRSQAAAPDFFEAFEQQTRGDSGRHRDDRGYARLRALWGTLLALAAAAALVLAVTVLGAPAQAHGPRPTVAITSACDEDAGPDGDVWTTLAFTARRGRTVLLDDGTARLQVWDVSGRSQGPRGGQWRTFELFGEDHVPDDEDLVVSGGEGHLRFDESRYGRQGGHALFYRIAFRGGRSQSVDVDTELRCEP